MHYSRQLPTSPRVLSPKPLKSVSTLELNSYKIDTTSLSEKARQIETLKTSLESQISQYKASELMFNSEIDKLADENTDLRIKIKKLQTELNKLKLEGLPVPNAQAKISSKNQQNEIKLLKITVSSLQDQVRSLKEKLAQKNQEITELQEYKKMYDIEVENKNNIMNFYENKLALFKKDNGVLISKYEEKISQLGSSLEMNNATIIQLQQGANPANSSIKTATTSNHTSSAMPHGLKAMKPVKEFETDKILSSSNDVKDKSVESPNSSSKNIKFLRPSKPSISIPQSRFAQKPEETPFKLQKGNESKNKENAPYSTKSMRNQVNQISVNSVAHVKTDLLINSNTKAKDKLSPKKNTYNFEGTAQTLRNNDAFLRLIKKISANLRDQNIKSETLKNFSQIRNFMNVASPLPSQVIELLEKSPFGPTGMDRLSVQECIQRMRRHLEKRYSSWSGSLLVELLIDKIEDVEIAYEVNSDEDGIEAGLSSEDEMN